VFYDIKARRKKSVLCVYIHTVLPPFLRKNSRFWVEIIQKIAEIPMQIG